MSTTGRSASGYSTWRLIAEELRREIANGTRPAGSRLPSENDLAERFGVHRNTVRQAVAALIAEDLVVSRRGSGTFVVESTVLVHRIGARTRLTDSLAPGEVASARLLDWAIEDDPQPRVSDRLRLDGRAALRIEGMRFVDGRPISRGTTWFVADLVPRMPDFPAVFERLGSITAALREIGIADYVRASTTVGARHATAAESADLALAPGAVLLVVRALDALPDGTPLSYGTTRFAASRVELDVEHVPVG
ncbi:MAG: phosphonate metabolism transcriptional regulator PhnF [Microbacteriaceae bacterium]|nr:phosphonate metabolism transcriptional regulator PhnF [Microbacteriaceae bacterium]MCL2795069.1 phosphonate metabolism transcriptional regulator PhnF [Microbacteriaceae bacterium]